MHVKGHGGAAQPKKAPTEKLTFAKLDKNKDGKLDKEELKQKGAEKFAKFAGKDGIVDRHEGVKAVKAEKHEDKIKKALSKYDANKDGKISGNEAEKVKAFDADGDGKVSKKEAAEGLKKFDKPGEDGKADGQLDEKELAAANKEIAKQKKEEKWDKAFGKIDGNKDDVVSGNEVGKVEGLDRDGDGKVSKAEVKAAKEFDKDGKAGLSKDEVKEAEKAAKKALGEHKAEEKKEEFNETLEKRWKKADGNEDEWLSGNERGTYRKQLDVDGDGRTTKEEFFNQDARKELDKRRAEAKLLGEDPSKVTLKDWKPTPKPADPAAPGAPAAPAAEDKTTTTTTATPVTTAASDADLASV